MAAYPLFSPDISRYKQTLSGNPCPICGDTKGSCREPDVPNVHLCVADNPVGATKHVGGVVLVNRGGVKSMARWNRWTLCTGNHFSVADRDKFGKQLIASLTLRDKDKQDLVRRGFTDDQIKRVYARSVTKFQKLPFELPPGFPGAGKDGLANSVDGYIFPILSINKELLGFQIRCDDPDSKYRWISSREGLSKLPSGEQPLAFYWPKDKEPKFVALVEGTGPKPFLTCEQTGALTIGAAGGLWASSPSQIIGAIKHLESEYKGLPWRLMPDAGAIENPDIYREMWKINELLEQFDIKMEVAWWGQSSKPSPGTEAKLGDADEVSLSVLEKAEIISSAQFFAMASPEVVKKANVNGLPVGGLDPKELRQSAERLVLLTGFEKKAQTYVEAARLGVRASELEMLVNTIYEEEGPEYQTEIKESLGKLLGIGEQDLDIRAHVHENLAAPIEMIASRMGRAPRLYIHCMLPVIASLVHTGSKVVVNKGSGFIEPLIINCALLGPTGSKKSPITGAVIGPIKKLQANEELRHKSMMDDYKRALKAEKGKKKTEQEEIEEPERSKKFIVDNFTIEALLEIFGDQPEKGFVAYKDELPSLIGDMGAYKNGGGSDNETLLSLWNGAGVIKHRVGGNSIFTTTSHASILGGIQPDKLTKLLLSHGGGTDEQGFFARILMMNMRAKPHVLPEDHDEYSIAPFLTYAYELVSRMEAIEFSFTPSAYDIYREYYNALEIRLHAEQNPAMRAAIAKMEGYAARLAGIFHVLWEVASGESEVSSTGSTLISDEIPPERVASAIAWCEFCLNEMTLVVTDSLAASGEKGSINFKIVEYLKGKEPLSPGVVRNSIWTLRQRTTPEVKKILDDMTEMGLIARTGTGRNAKYGPTPE